jgi:uncharacterized membrane-anchored protein
MFLWLISFAKSPCPKISAIPANAMAGTSNKYRFKRFSADFSIPKGTLLLAEDNARHIAKHDFGWDICATKDLVGFIVPEKEWRSEGMKSLQKSWLIAVYYVPEFIETEDVISADYDLMADQARASFVDENKLRVANSLAPINVTGWAIPPGLRADDVVSWSLNAVEGNQPQFQTVNMKAVTLGRVGRFQFEMSTPITRLNEFHDILISTARAVSFDKGVDMQSRDYDRDKAPLMTVGDLIAEDVKAMRGKPLTWSNYFKATIHAAIQHLGLYLLEILGFLTVSALVFFIRGKRAIFVDDGNAYDHDDYDDKFDEDEDSSQKRAAYQRPSYERSSALKAPRAAPLINGVPLKPAHR